MKVIDGRWIEDYEGVWWWHILPTKYDAAIWKREADSYQWIIWRKDNARSLWKRIKDGFDYTFEDAVEAADAWIAANPYPVSDVPRPARRRG